MPNQERGIQLSRRRLLQLSAVRTPRAGNLEAIARAAEITEVVLSNPSVAMRFVDTIRNIFARTFKSETPDIFKDRPEEIELFPRDRAINAVTDLLQPHVPDLTKWRLDPQGAIEPITDYLLALSQRPIFNAAVVMASPDKVTPLYHIYEISMDPPVSMDGNDIFSAAIRMKHGGKIDTPGMIHAAEQNRAFQASLEFWGKGPYMSSVIHKSMFERIEQGKLADVMNRIDKTNMQYLGTLLPIR